MTRKLAVLTLATSLLMSVSPAWAQGVGFSQVRVVGGPVLEYPAHWKLADEATIQNRAHAAKAVTDIAGLDLPAFMKRNRVVIESQPVPSTAQIRASIISPQEYTQADLAALTVSDLHEIKLELEKGYSKVSAAGAVKFLDVYEPRVETIAGRLALVISYTRYTDPDPSVWHVQQIKIPFADRILALTLSYRASDAATMKPIVERVKRTLAF